MLPAAPMPAHDTSLPDAAAPSIQDTALEKRRVNARVLAKPILVMGLLILAGLAIRHLHGHQLDAVFARTGHGPAGMALFAGGGMIACALGLPRQVAAFTAAYLFGPVAGMALAMTAQLAGCVINVLTARWVTRGWTRPHTGWVVRTERALTAHPFTATLMLRLLPVGHNLTLNLLAGASRIRLSPFLAGSALGFVPQTVIFALLGSGVRVDRAWQTALGVALFVLSAGCGLWLMRRQAAASRVQLEP